MLKRFFIIMLGFFTIIIFILSNVFLINAVLYNNNYILLFSITNFISTFLFSVCFSNIFVCKTYKKTVINALTSFLNSNSFHHISKGEYLQELIDYPQNFMFLYASILEASVYIITIILSIIILPTNIKKITLMVLPTLVITIFVFITIRKQEEQLFSEQTINNQESSNDFLNFINGMDNFRGVGKEEFIFNKVLEKKKNATNANMKFLFNQNMQQNIFSYTSFIPIIFLLILNNLIPNRLEKFNILGCIITIKILLSLFYNFISNLIEIKLYFMYKKNHKKWIGSLKPMHKPIISLKKSSIFVNLNTIIKVSDFSIKNGDFIQISGDSGSGKSCFLDYLIGFRNAQKEENVFIQIIKLVM